MARFRGTMRGSGERVSRLGKTGLFMTAAGWKGHVLVELFVDSKTGMDWALVTLVDRHDDSRTLYRGPVSDYRDPRGTRIPIITDREIEHE
jgi:hypothetical protein